MLMAAPALAWSQDNAAPPEAVSATPAAPPVDPPLSPEVLAAQLAAQTAAEERRLALEAAERAKAAAERAVSAEMARLLGIEQRMATMEQSLQKGRAALAVRRDAVIGWRQRAREAKSGRAPADATYDALRGELRIARRELSAELTQIESGASATPVIGADPLQELPPGIDIRGVLTKRLELETRAQRIATAERALRAARAEALLDEVDTLNDERLSLLPHLTSAKRAAVTGFTAAGWDQARSEMRHLVLIVRYHRYAVTEWAASVRKPGDAFWTTLAQSGAILVPWALILSVFVWWRRKSPQVLNTWERRLEIADRKALHAEPSLSLRAVRFLRAIRGPLEWLAMFFALTLVLPSAMLNLLEVQLLTIIILWALAGALVVNAINAALADSSLIRPTRYGGTGDIRLRSLRLVGTVVVVFALVLIITSRLVGEGTIYRWVSSTSWLAVIPVFLILVRWWRDVIFSRIERTRRKSAFQQWVMANRTGWPSFFAAIAAAVQMFSASAIRIGRRWLSSFDLVRRGSVFLFRREMKKQDRDQPLLNRTPIDGPLFDQFGPDIPSTDWISTEADEKLIRLIASAADASPAIFALVGERGGGKSTALQRLQSEVADAVHIDCGEGATVAALLRRLARAAGSDKQPGPPAILLDNVQALIKPVMGGLRDFDDLIALIRRSGGQTSWYLAIDSSVWQFLDVARGSRPLFDDVVRLGRWTESAISALLTARSKQAGVDPTFEDLLDALPSDTDEIDRLEALAARRAAYMLLIWDYSRGNPGVALQVWRQSLAVGPSDRIHVRPLRTPSESSLDLLSDDTLFVLRAVLQLSPASQDDLQGATQFSAGRVANALRFCSGKGFIVEHGDGVAPSWTWFRAITRTLERRHLLVSQ